MLNEGLGFRDHIPRYLGVVASSHLGTYRHYATCSLPGNLCDTALTTSPVSFGPEADLRFNNHSRRHDSLKDIFERVLKAVILPAYPSGVPGQSHVKTYLYTPRFPYAFL